MDVFVERTWTYLQRVPEECPAFAVPAVLTG